MGHPSDGTIPPEGTKRKSVFFEAVYCFFVFYTAMLIFSIPLLCIIIYRTVTSLILRVLFRGRYTLLNCSDTPFASRSGHANLFNITFIVHVKGVCDIQHLRQRLKTRLLQKDRNGRVPYGKLLKAGIEKWGYFCWEDKRNSIDFTHHVRFCPGAGDMHKIYTETEVFDAVAQLADVEWDHDKPKWEILVTPKVKPYEDAEVCSVITVKIHHQYLDGISFVQFLLNCVNDEPPPKLMFDPVNPPMPPVPFYKRILLYIQTFLMGPYVSLRLLAHPNNDIYNEGPLTGPKYFGRTKMPISLEDLRNIRKSKGSTTQAILHSAFTGALAKMSKRKGFIVPDYVSGGITIAKYPYPDEYPHNNGGLLPYHPMKIGIVDPMERLAEMNTAIKTSYDWQYAQLWMYLFVQLIGILPISLVRATMTLTCAYVISNIPGIAGRASVNGAEVERVFGIPALINQIRYTAGVGCYNGKFVVGFGVEKSQIIGCRRELEDFIEEFENEIRYLIESGYTTQTVLEMDRVK